MSVDIDHFVAVGIPLTPFQDADLINEAPFQLGLLKLYDQFDQLLASTNPVVPVSNEINCLSSGCHLSEQAILNQHAAEAGFDPGNTPILCATCHASNALGMAGNPNLPSLSEAIHKHHGEYTDDCYKCHPGPVTHCLRDVMSVKHGFVCQTCHGSVTQVGESISSGREPWFQEPSCGALSCHGPNFAEEPGKLYRMSRGHGGLYCSACHGEPHAIVPSREPNDNLQNISLQGHAGTLDMCIVCHGVVPSGAGPHGVLASNCCLHPGDADHNTIVSILDVTFMISAIYKNGPHPPCNGSIDGQYPEADANGNGAFNILDVTYLIAYLYKSGPAPICGPA